MSCSAVACIVFPYPGNSEISSSSHPATSLRGGREDATRYFADIPSLSSPFLARTKNKIGRAEQTRASRNTKIIFFKKNIFCVLNHKYVAAATCVLSLNTVQYAGKSYFQRSFFPQKEPLSFLDWPPNPSSPKPTPPPR